MGLCDDSVDPKRRGSETEREKSKQDSPKANRMISEQMKDLKNKELLG